jgi:hypothetical protein
MIPILAAFWLATAQSAPLQDPFALPTELALSQQPPPADVPMPGRRDADDDLGLAASVRGRYTIPFGYADGDFYFYAGGGGAAVYVDSYVSWADIFDPGWGAELEIEVFLGSERKYGRFTRFGFYLTAETDHFYGDTLTGPLNTRVAVGDMDMTSFIVGATVQHPVSDQMVSGGRAGIGAVHYTQVDADFSGNGFTPFTGEFLEETWTFAFEARVYGGVKLGPLMLSAGIGTRIYAPPHDGDVVNLSSGAFWTFDIDLAATLGF